MNMRRILGLFTLVPLLVICPFINSPLLLWFKSIFGYGAILLTNPEPNISSRRSTSVPGDLTQTSRHRREGSGWATWPLATSRLGEPSVYAKLLPLIVILGTQVGLLYIFIKKCESSFYIKFFLYLRVEKEGGVNSAANHLAVFYRSILTDFCGQ